MGETTWRKSGSWRSGSRPVWPNGSDERGFTAVEWLLIALGVITIAGIAVAAIKAYVTGQTNKLGQP